MCAAEQASAARFRSFWGQLLEKARLQTSLFRGVTAPSGPELSVQQGPARWSLILSENSALAALQVAESPGDGPVVIAGLLDHRSEIELACGTRLTWHRSSLEDGSLLAIVWRVEDYGFEITGDWPYLQDTLVAAIARMHGACRPYLLGRAGAAPDQRPRETDLTALAEKFTAEMIDSYYILGEETGYWANYFLREVRRRGGVEAARQLLYKPELSSGLEQLRKIRRLDISVEAYVLRPEYEPLFTAQELETARARLRTQGYPV